MELRDKIKSLRLKNSMTQKELGIRLGVSEVSIRSWESGMKKPYISAVISMAKIFNITTDSLLGVDVDPIKDNQPLTRKEAMLLSNYRILDKHGQKVVDTLCALEKSRIEDEKELESKEKILSFEDKPHRYIPRYTTPSAAGYSVPLDGDDFEMILVDVNTPKDADFAVGIQGNSMYPYINDGDTVFVKRDCELEVGDIGIFCVDGAMFCKQYFIDNQQNIILISANPELKDTNIIVRAESNSSIKCYGKVLLGCKIELPSYIYD